MRTVLSSADGLVLFKISFVIIIVIVIVIVIIIIIIIHKSNNFLDYDWFKKLLFSTNLLAKLLSGSSISQSHSKL